MLKSTYDIGQIAAKGKDETQMYTTDIGDAYIHELAIILIKSGGTLQYSRCEKREKTRRNYLFREKKGNVKIPMSITLRDVGKGSTPILDKFINFGKANKTPLATKVSEIISIHKDTISTTLDEMAAAISNKKERKFYTVVIADGDKELYPGDIEEFRTIFLENILSSSGEYVGTCFLCGKRRTIGLKASDIFKFASFDKPGFAYEMDDENYYVNMPLCQDCFSKLALGKKVLDEDLSMGFYSSRVYIIPRFYAPDEADAGDAIGDARRGLSMITNLKDTAYKNSGYSNLETFMLPELAEGLYATLNFVFYSINNQEMKINLSALDVPPSRLKNISKKMSEVEDELKGVFGTAEYSPSVQFSTIHDVFKDNRLKTFFDYLEAIFKGSGVSLVPLKRATLEITSSKKLRGDPYVTRAKQLMTFALFMDRLQKDIKGGNPLMAKEREERIKEFFEKYPTFFRTDEEKLLFIMGQIHSRIARFQQERNIASTVDLKLKAYNMRPLDFMNHFKDLKWKATQYGKEMDPVKVKGPLMSLFQVADGFLLSSGFEWKAPIEDLNYAFLAGELATGVFRKELEPTEAEPKDSRE